MEVVVAAAVVVLIVEIDAGDEPVRPVEPEAVVVVAETAPDEVALQIHDAAVLHRQQIAEVAPRVIVASFDAAVLARGRGVDESEPLLLDVLARMERDVVRKCGARVGLGLRARHAAGVVGLRLIGQVDDREQAAVLAEVDGRSGRWPDD